MLRSAASSQCNHPNYQGPGQVRSTTNVLHERVSARRTARFDPVRDKIHTWVNYIYILPSIYM